ncbi:MAG TPA: hypothetical protein VHP80_14320 [Candidatus Acidoferrum sp.]|nr:hypothetical protein [Candidatus Acidoferrum sp.]
MSAPSHSDRAAQHQASGQSAANAALDPEQLEVAAGTARQNVEGWVPELTTDAELRSALEEAFEYRGDVTITRKDGATVEGYIFDRSTGDSLATSFVRVLPKDSNNRVKISYAEISALAFTGRDTAAGKSYEAWVKKYWAKKTTGEGEASLQPDALD